MPCKIKLEFNSKILKIREVQQYWLTIVLVHQYLLTSTKVQILEFNSKILKIREVRQHTSAYAAAYVSIRQRTLPNPRGTTLLAH